MNAAGGSGVRTSKAIIALAVLLTSAVWLLGTMVYLRLTAPSPKAAQACAPAGDAPGRPATRSESLAVALASMASANTVERAALQAPAPSPAVANKPAPDDATTSPMSKDELLARQRAEAYTLDQQLLTEEVDPVWAPKLQRQTAELVAGLGGGIHLDEVTCRETLCRAKVSHADAKAREDETERLLSMPIIAGQALAYSPSHDDRSTVLYFSRKGTYLSVLQEQAPLTVPAWRAAEDPAQSDP
jgi:hypothetical protein